MRYRIAVEGRDTILGRTIEPDAIRFDETKPYPVTLGNSFALDSVIGTATELKREGDEITAEIKWNPSMTEGLIDDVNKIMWLTIYGTNVDEERLMGKHLVKGTDLKAIFISLDPHDPWTEAS